MQVDRLYGWKACRNSPIRKAMLQQTKDVHNEFNMRVTQVVKNSSFLFVSWGRLFLLMFAIVIFLVSLLDCHSVQGTGAKY